ncbi:MAG TPA: SDR family oxidoreductase [Ktedonobacteraceae bacterium]|nr:SDR family oxidoreductase [Ktedonobacteraceae bacterium]
MSSQQVVLVTGTSSGFGQLTAETLARQGNIVFAAMRNTRQSNAERAQQFRVLAEREQLAIHVVDLDTNDEASVDRTVASIVESTGRIDVLVNNVGIGAWGIAEGYTLAQVKELFETNFFSTVRMNRAVLPVMRRQQSGLLVHISAAVGRFVLPFMVNYSAAKHAVEALAEGYRYELAPLGIDSVIIEPGAYPTVGSQQKLMGPQEVDRVAGYGSLPGRAQSLYDSNAQTYATAAAPNPQDVADAIARLIQTPSGQRPLRTTVGGPPAPMIEPINALTDQIQAQTFQYMGLGDLVSVAARQ